MGFKKKKAEEKKNTLQSRNLLPALLCQFTFPSYSHSVCVDSFVRKSWTNKGSRGGARGDSVKTVLFAEI